MTIGRLLSASSRSLPLKFPPMAEIPTHSRAWFGNPLCKSHVRIGTRVYLRRFDNIPATHRPKHIVVSGYLFHLRRMLERSVRACLPCSALINRTTDRSCIALSTWLATELLLVLD